MWFGVQSGTGIWVNIGKTIVFQYHHDAFKFRRIFHKYTIYNGFWSHKKLFNTPLFYQITPNNVSKHRDLFLDCLSAWKLSEALSCTWAKAGAGLVGVIFFISLF
jgi:hypothetical protein